MDWISCAMASMPHPITSMREKNCDYSFPITSSLKPDRCPFLPTANQVRCFNFLSLADSNPIQPSPKWPICRSLRIEWKMGTTSKGMVRSNEGCELQQLSSSFIFEEIIYDIAVHTCSNESGNEASAVFMTLVGKVIETKKLLLQFPENTVHPLRSQQVDLFRFVDQDIGMVSVRVPAMDCSSRVDRFQPKAIRFSHDGRGFPKNWLLAKVEVTLPHRNKLYR